MLHYTHLSLNKITVEPCIFAQLIPDAPSKDVQNSIAQFGVINPPLVRETNHNQYELVFGLEILLATQELGLQMLPCAIIASSLIPVQYYLFLCHIFKERGLTPAMEALLLQDASRHLDKEEIDQLMVAMGYKPGKGTLKNFLTLASAGRQILRPLHSGTLSTHSALQLCTLSLANSSILIHYIEQYTLSGSKQKQMIRRMMDLIRRENTSAEILCQEWEETAKKTDPKNTPQLAKRFLEYIEKRHTPHLYEATKEFEAFADGLHLPPGMHLSPCQSFENDSCSLMIQFANRKKLIKNLELAKTLIAK